MHREMLSPHAGPLQSLRSATCHHLTPSSPASPVPSTPLLHHTSSGHLDHQLIWQISKPWPFGDFVATSTRERPWFFRLRFRCVEEKGRNHGSILRIHFVCGGNIVEYRSIIDPWKEVTEVYDCVDICVGRTCSFYLEVH